MGLLSGADRAAGQQEEKVSSGRDSVSNHPTSAYTVHKEDSGVYRKVSLRQRQAQLWNQKRWVPSLLVLPVP